MWENKNILLIITVTAYNNKIQHKILCKPDLVVVVFIKIVETLVQVHQHHSLYDVWEYNCIVIVYSYVSLTALSLSNSNAYWVCKQRYPLPKLTYKNYSNIY